MGKVITDFRGPFAMLTAKGTLRKKLGKPKNPIGWEFSIYAKIMQISKGRKLSPYKAWMQLCKHRHFDVLMKPHFQKQKKYKGNTKWREVITDPDWQHKFYTNNISRTQLIKRLKKVKFEYIKKA